MGLPGSVERAAPVYPSAAASSMPGAAAARRLSASCSSTTAWSRRRAERATPWPIQQIPAPRISCAACSILC